MLFLGEQWWGDAVGEFPRDMLPGIISPSWRGFRLLISSWRRMMMVRHVVTFYGIMRQRYWQGFISDGANLRLTRKSLVPAIQILCMLCVEWYSLYCTGQSVGCSQTITSSFNHTIDLHQSPPGLNLLVVRGSKLKNCHTHQGCIRIRALYSCCGVIKLNGPSEYITCALLGAKLHPAHFYRHFPVLIITPQSSEMFS